jgi:hypothetical protein
LDKLTDWIYDVCPLVVDGPGPYPRMVDFVETEVVTAVSLGGPRARLEPISIETLAARPDCSVRYVYCSGIESQSLTQLRSTLSVIMRVLEPAGVVRIATPDLDAVVYDYLLGRGIAGTAEKSRAQRLNDWRSDTSGQHIFNEDDLRLELEAAGFVDVWRHAAGGSSITHFLDCEQQGGTELVLEGQKPAAAK